MGEKYRNSVRTDFKPIHGGVVTKFEVDISKNVGADSFPVNLYFFLKNWQHCKLATIRIFSIFLIDSFEWGITAFGII